MPDRAGAGGRKQAVRAIVKQVHPDLFYQRPIERQQNCRSLQVLYDYIDGLSEGRSLQRCTITFFVKREGAIRCVEAVLPSWGSLEPLFAAFGIEGGGSSNIDCTADLNGHGDVTEQEQEVLSYLRTAMRRALQAAEAYEALQHRVKELRLVVEQEFGLISLQLSHKVATSLGEQRQEVEALEVLAASLRDLRSGGRPDVTGLHIAITHPHSSPLDSYTPGDGVAPSGGHDPLHTQPARHPGHISDDGVVHLVAERAGIAAALRRLDLEQARLLSRVTSFWLQRCRSLMPVLRRVVRVREVWADARTEASAQKAVLWAGYFLKQRELVDTVVRDHDFAFSILLHNDENSPMLDYIERSSVLQVRTDCPADVVVSFLSSEAGCSAHAQAEAAHSSDDEEAALFDEIRSVFRARDVVRVCSAYEQHKVLQGARRLLDNADLIRRDLDFSGVSIAIDDCYDVWGSGFISIPYNFTLGELQPRLSKLLPSGRARLCDTQQADGVSQPEGEVRQPQRRLDRHTAPAARVRPTCAKHTTVLSLMRRSPCNFRHWSRCTAHKGCMQSSKLT